MINFIKKNTGKLISIAVICVIFIYFGRFASTANGKIVINNYLSSFPFSKNIIDLLKRFFNMSEGLPSVTIHSFLYDTSATMITTVVKAAFFRLGSVLFLKTNYANVTNQILGSRTFVINELEKELKSPLYTLKAGFVSLICALAGSYITPLLTSPLIKFLDSIGESLALFGNIIIFIAVFLGFSILYAYLDNHTIQFSMLRTWIYKFIPAIIDTFITNLLIFLSYTLWITRGLDSITIFSILALLLWCGIAKWLCEKMQYFVSGIGLLDHSEGNLFSAITWFAQSLATILMAYSMCIENYMDGMPIFGAICKLPIILDAKNGLSIHAQLEAYSIDFGYSYLLLLCLCIISAISNTMLNLHSRNIIWNSFLWSFSQSLRITIIIIPYNLYLSLLGASAYSIQTIVYTIFGIILVLLFFAPKITLNAVFQSLGVILYLLVIEANGLMFPNMTDPTSYLLIAAPPIIFGLIIHFVRTYTRL